MKRRFGYAALTIYVLGTWVYGVAYIWQHWAGYENYGMLGWYAFHRAIIWPVWLVIALL